MKSVPSVFTLNLIECEFRFSHAHNEYLDSMNDHSKQDQLDHDWISFLSRQERMPGEEIDLTKLAEGDTFSETTLNSD